MLALRRLTWGFAFKLTYNPTKLLKGIGWFTATAERDYNASSDPELVTIIFQVSYFPIVIRELLPVFTIADVNRAICVEIRDTFECFYHLLISSLAIGAVQTTLATNIYKFALSPVRINNIDS